MTAGRPHLLMDILASLQDDHVNFAQVASLAREELRLLETGETVDYSLLEDVMCYVTGYLDTHHHPTEDVVFERLKEIAPDTADEVNSILAEHKELIARGRRFLEAIRAVAHEAFVLREDLLHRGHDYLSMLERHMNTEEDQLFPRARKELTDEDWERLGERIERRPDPLFGPALQEDYRRLWQRIQAHRRDKADEQLDQPHP